MNTREFLNAVISSSENAEIVAFATESLKKLDARNEKRANTPNKNQVANEPIKVAIVEFVTSKGSAIASEIASACEISTQKVSALAKILVEEGKLKSSTVKVKGKGEVKSYTI